MQGKKPFSFSVSFLPPEIVDWILKIPRRLRFSSQNWIELLKRLYVLAEKYRLNYICPLQSNLLEKFKEIAKRKERGFYLYCRLWRKQGDKKSRQIHKASWSFGQSRIQESDVSFRLTGTASFRALPKLDFKNWNFLQITWIKKRQAVSRLPQVAF